jgi:hypothetical protein
MEYALSQTDVETLELALARPETGPDPFVSAVQKWFKPRLTPAAIALLIAYTDRGLDDAYKSAIQLSSDDWTLLGLSKDTIGDIERARDQLDEIRDENQGFLEQMPNTLTPTERWVDLVAVPLVFGGYAGEGKTVPLFAQARILDAANEAGIVALDDAWEQFKQDVAENVKSTLTFGAGLGVVAALGFGAYFVARAQGWLR